MDGDDRPSISVRKYIKWGNDPPSEPTSTLVLTSPLKHYVDTRIQLPLPLPFSSRTNLPAQALDWAFAGTSSSTPATETKPVHTVWTHWVDSKTVNGHEVRDEGDMIVLDSGEVVERGEMVNPSTGVLEEYEESWAEMRLLGEKVGWVVKVEDEVKRVKGMIVRIGGIAQGFLRRGQEVGTKRWSYKGGVEGWPTIVEIGEFDIPESIFGDAEILEGDVFMGEDELKWECVEKFVWN